MSSAQHHVPGGVRWGGDDSADCRIAALARGQRNVTGRLLGDKERPIVRSGGTHPVCVGNRGAGDGVTQLVTHYASDA